MRPLLLTLLLGCSASAVTAEGPRDGVGDAFVADAATDGSGERPMDARDAFVADAATEGGADAGEATCGWRELAIVGAREGTTEANGWLASVGAGRLTVANETSDTVYTFRVPGVPTGDLSVGTPVSYRAAGGWEYVEVEEGPTFAAGQLESFWPYASLELPLGVGELPFARLCTAEDEMGLPCTVLTFELGLRVEDRVIGFGETTRVGDVHVSWLGGLAQDSVSPLCFPEPVVSAAVVLRRDP
ncbi:MAG: hypothetical protein AAGH15_18445 [Myxococcota bacterium]